MKKLGRILGLVFVLVVLVGFYRVAIDQRVFPVEQTGQSATAQSLEPGRSLVNLPSGSRMTFQEAMKVTLPPSSYAEIWGCSGLYSVISGPASIPDVCAVAFYRK